MALTDEDKKWFHDEMQHLHGEIQQLHGEIQQLHGEIQQLHGEIQQLHGEIQHAKDGLRGEIQELKIELRGEIQHAKDESIAAARDMQTEVITFIGSMTEPLKLRLQHLETNAVNEGTVERVRLTAIEDRLFRLEKRVLGGLP